MLITPVWHIKLDTSILITGGASSRRGSLGIMDLPGEGQTAAGSAPPSCGGDSRR